MNWDRMRALIVKEFIQVMRDKITLAIILFMPLAQLLIFGFAINTDIKHLKTVVFDQSRTQESREMINSLTPHGEQLLRRDKVRRERARGQRERRVGPREGRHRIPARLRARHTGRPADLRAGHRGRDGQPERLVGALGGSRRRYSRRNSRASASACRGRR